MKRSLCGCTLQHPGAKCQAGQKLFAAAGQAFQFIANRPGIAEDEQWIAYHLTRLAYLDHLNGWQEGDVKVRRERGIWMVYARLCGQWVFWFGTKEYTLLSTWLADREYQPYMQVKSKLPGHHFLGYYRKRGHKNPDIEGGMAPMPSSETNNRQSPPSPQGQENASASQLDLKTQVAIQIALLVAQCPELVTFVDRQYIQWRAINLLMSHGIQVGQNDERAIAELINEALRQKEDMRMPPDNHTRPPSQ